MPTISSHQGRLGLELFGRILVASSFGFLKLHLKLLDAPLQLLVFADGEPEIFLEQSKIVVDCLRLISFAYD